MVTEIKSFVVVTHNTTDQSRKKNKRFHGLNKIKDFYCVKTSFKKSKDTTQLGKKYLQHISNKGFVSEYAKNSDTTPLKLIKL